MDPWVLWTGLGWLVPLAAVVGAVWLPGLQKPNWDRIAKNRGLPVIGEVRAKLASDSRMGVPALAISLAGGLIVACAALVATRVTDVFEMAYADFLVLVVALGVGSMILVFRSERKRQRADVRFARTRAVTRTDYQSKLWQWLPRITVALLVLGMVIRAVITPDPTRDIPVFLVIYTVVCVATLVVCEIMCRWIVSRGQPAGSELELAWDDSFKSSSLLILTYIPAMLGAFGSQIGSALAISEFVQIRIDEHTRLITITPETPATHFLFFILGLMVQDFIGLVALGILIIALLIAVVTKFQHRYLRRLWPDLVPAVSTTGVNLVLARNGA